MSQAALHRVILASNGGIRISLSLLLVLVGHYFVWHIQVLSEVYS